MKILNTLEIFPSIKYFVGKGNNSKLIKQLLSKRRGWTRVKLADIGSANII